ncbi:GtrA family protein [Paenibacillus vulneris]|uniref:GtrA family protein n=1 Tax=Paenibacillus vulneris TaxID=1133364 RepID=A0ABW3UFC5_9BACL
MLNKICNSSVVKFLLVGIINTIIGLSVMYACLKIMGFNYWISTFVGNSIGALVSFILNRRFTFNSTALIKDSFWKFVIVIIGSYFIAYTASKEIVDLFVLYLSNNDIAVLLGTFLYTVLNYLGQKHFVFKKKKIAVNSN